MSAGRDSPHCDRLAETPDGDGARSHAGGLGASDAAALDAENAALRSIIDAAELGAIVLDTELRLEGFTLPAARLFELSTADIGSHIANLAHAFPDALLADDAATVLDTATRTEMRLRAADGRTLLRRIAPRRAEDGSVAGVVVTFVEISAADESDSDADESVRRLNTQLELRVAERTAQLKLSENRVRAVLDAAVDAIITVDESGRIETFNKAAEEMFGYARSETLGQNVSMLMAKALAGRNDAYIRRFLTTRQPRLIGRVREFRARRKDGSEFPIQLSVSPVDSLGLFTGIIRDISEQRELQAEIVRIATAEQRRIGEELHDSTQQELTGLGLLAQHLGENVDSSNLEETRRIARRIARGIAEANLHVQQLTKGLVPVSVDAEGLMIALDDLAHQTQEATGISCRLACPSPVRIASDDTALALYRIAQEAVTNAVKHAAADSIAVRLEQTKEHLVLAIEDNGVGIDIKKARKRGLGLRIMEHRCELIGGSFAAAVLKPRGTVVSCRIPVHEAEASA